jgi:hypothetical protein
MSFAIYSIKTVQINQNTYLFRLLNASITSFNYSKSDERKNSDIIGVDGCKRGVVGAVLALARSCENR